MIRKDMLTKSGHVSWYMLDVISGVARELISIVVFFSFAMCMKETDDGVWRNMKVTAK